MTWLPPVRVELWPMHLSLSRDGDGQPQITYSDRWDWSFPRTFDSNEAAIAAWNSDKPMVLMVHMPEITS